MGVTERFKVLFFYMLISNYPPADRGPCDKIDDDDHYYDNHTDFKMWQGSLPHKK